MDHELYSLLGEFTSEEEQSPRVDCLEQQLDDAFQNYRTTHNVDILDT